jgi:hypothetical protein
MWIPASAQANGGDSYLVIVGCPISKDPKDAEIVKEWKALAKELVAPSAAGVAIRVEGRPATLVRGNGLDVTAQGELVLRATKSA